jgi:predicted TIM-barrel fold metal-dependent hydrolase
MIVDCHCHLFSRNDLNINHRTTGKLVRKIQDSALPVKVGSSERVLRFIDHVLNYEAETLFLKMRDTYGEDYAAVPLMMDGTYVTRLPGEDLERTSPLDRLGEHIITPLAQSLGRPNEPNLNHGKRNLFYQNFTTQMNELKRLKKAYPNHIYPFLGIDPRRDEDDLKGKLMDLIKKKVGPGKTFSGIKLYTALGYSPTHPFLYNSNRKVSTLYYWCQKNRIPLTVHFSPTGFAHINDTNPVVGDVYHAPSGEIVPACDLFEGGVMTFEKKFFRHGFNDLVDERQHRLNHPLLWRKVLETYPRLKINFAHMGGYTQVPLYLNGNHAGFWTRYALDFLQDYSHTRVDMSNFNFSHRERNALEGVKNKIYDKLSRSAKKRVLYGSDFYMLYLMEKELTNYYDKFCHVFGKKMDLVARENPLAFIQ